MPKAALKTQANKTAALKAVRLKLKEIDRLMKEARQNPTPEKMAKINELINEGYREAAEA